MAYQGNIPAASYFSTPAVQQFNGDGSTTTFTLNGAGYFQGENGATGDTTNGKGDIFRVHEQQLDTNTTIAIWRQRWVLSLSDCGFWCDADS
jgi:hypothetical protein